MRRKTGGLAALPVGHDASREGRGPPRRRHLVDDMAKPSNSETATQQLCPPSRASLPGALGRALTCRRSQRFTPAHPMGFEPWALGGGCIEGILDGQMAGWFSGWRLAGEARVY